LPVRDFKDGWYRVTDATDKKKIDAQLRGNTLRVYLYVLKLRGDTVGVRQVQRALGFSSPTLAVHHLEKLRDLGLLAKESTEYRLIQEIDVGIFKQFVRMGDIFVPRQMIYAVAFTTLLIYYLFELGELNFYSVYALILAVTGTLTMWFETFRAWSEKPA
jgi:hypothetical protein